jgi:hypothetical protein
LSSIRENQRVSLPPPQKKNKNKNKNKQTNKLNVNGNMFSVSVLTAHAQQKKGFESGKCRFGKMQPKT